MLPTMYGNYTTKRQAGVGQNGEPAGPTVEVDGVQKLTPNANAIVAGHLSALYFDAPVQVLAGTALTALTCDVIKQKGGSCEVNALADLRTRPPGTIFVADFATSNPTSSQLLIVTKEKLPEVAGPSSNFAVFNPEPAGITKKEKEEKKDKGATILVGAGAGGAAGFFALGPPGALVGAGAGALLANWLAA